ncbi:S1 family peptidase [Actinoplanes sp. NPDC023714]|uniref:S1 family peptidase n=1 Tax=Actinoplanes sp. NPDC023714 TaxID=3154322 RepID=UPI0033D7130C
MIVRQALSAGAAGLLLTAVMAAPGSGASAAAAADCTVAAPDTARLNTARTIDGGPVYAKWLEEGATPATNAAVQKAAQRHFKIAENGKESIAELARRGYLGAAVDHNTKSVKVVVTPEYAGKAAGLRGAMSTARAAGARASTEATPLQSDVIAGCHSGEKIAKADELLRGKAWHASAKKATFSYYLDASDSRLHVSFDPDDTAAAEAARTALGDVAVVTVGEAARSGRLDDGEAHYGGAGVRAGSGGINTNTCTTTFAVRRNSNGQRGGLTAGHCFSNGQAIYSSTQFWGTAWGEANYPTYDMMGVASSAETYDNQIHVDPCCPNTRNITSKRNPVVGDSVCLSGMITRAVCGLVVSSVSASFCDDEGCTTGLMQARRANDVTVRGGDSGGPVYIRSGTANAVALGMIIAYTDSGRNAFAERIGIVESHLGVTVLTS